MIENYIWHNIALNVKFLYSVLFHWSIYTEITQLGRERGDTAMSNKASKPYIRLRLTPLINPNGPWWLNTHKKSHLDLFVKMTANFCIYATSLQFCKSDSRNLEVKAWLFFQCSPLVTELGIIFLLSGSVV